MTATDEQPAHITLKTIADAQDAVAALDAILSVYEEAFAQEPYCEGPRDVAHFMELYQRECLQPGFRLVLAKNGADGLAGFAYGYRLQSDATWWDNIDAELPEEFTREDGRRTFVIKEIAVRAPYQRQGVGRAAHDELLSGLDAPRVTLAMRPEAIPASRFYEALGYQEVGMSTPWDGAPTYRFRVRTLHGA